MSKPKYILAIDQGTTSSRAIIFDNNLKVISWAQEELNQYFPYSGYVEHHPEEIWKTVLNVAIKAMHKAGVTKKEIICIGITNQRETTVIWDKITGQPLHNAIVWQSRQSASICEKWKKSGYEDMVRQKTGLVIDAYFSASKIRWILDKYPSSEDRARKGEIAFGTIDTWLIWKLSKGKRHVTDVSNASRTMLMNLHSCSWDEELLNVFQIPKQILPDILENTVEFCICAQPELEGIPVMGMAGDQQAALFGQLCFQSGKAKNTYGTGCFMLINTGGQIIESRSGLLTTLAWKINQQACYALEGSVLVAGSAIQWLRDALGIISQSSETEAIALSINDSEGVYFVPALSGLGTPYWKSEAKGIITGLTHATGKAHIVRATLEAMAYQSAEVFEIMQKESKLKLRSLSVDGGASENNFLMQFQADLLQCEVTRPANKESTAMGAAMMAGLTAGVWDKIEILKSLVATDRTFQPKISKTEAEIKLLKWKDVVKKCILNL